MSTSTIEDEGKAIAEALGVIYTGPQYHKGELYCHLFTDPLTGSTFAATNKGNAWARFFALREEFGAPLPDNIPPEWKDFTLRFRGNLAKAFKEMGWLPARASPIIHEATSVNPDPAEFMPVEVVSAFPKGAKSNFNTQERAEIDKFIEDVPDKNDTLEINYWLDWKGKKVYLEGWIDQCLSGTGFPPMGSFGDWDDKIDYMVRDTHRTLPEKQEERNRPYIGTGHWPLIEGGFREFEAGEKDWLYGVSWGVYTKEEEAPSTHPLVLERFPYPAPEYIELGGESGELKVKIPPARGAKLDEGSVIRTSDKCQEQIYAAIVLFLKKHYPQFQNYPKVKVCGEEEFYQEYERVNGEPLMYEGRQVQMDGFFDTEGNTLIYRGIPDSRTVLHELAHWVQLQKYGEGWMNDPANFQEQEREAEEVEDKYSADFAYSGNLPATSTLPLVLERFPYPAPEYIELGGEIGELRVKIPPARGAKLDEGSVIRTSEKHDKAVEHLGYYSVSLTDEEKASLETRVPTDIELINESQDRLRKTKVIQDEQLSPLQLAHLNLARAIAEETDCVPPGGIYAAIIPPASDKVRTTGLYGTRTGTLYLSIEMLPKGRNAIDTLVHELGHHLQFSSTGEAEDLTPSHAGAMKSIAEKLTQGLNSGDYDRLLVTIQY